jgi:hypothetical protein
MIKNYQTIVDAGKGNCMQAAVASLLDMPLEKVPNFIEFGQNWFSTFYNFLKENDYEYNGTLYNHYNNLRLSPNDDVVNQFKELENEEGINGYFFGVVYSPKYYNPNDASPKTHAVIVDKNFNVVYDVNPEYIENTIYPESDVIKYNGIISIYLINRISK